MNVEGRLDPWHCFSHLENAAPIAFWHSVDCGVEQCWLACAEHAPFVGTEQVEQLAISHRFDLAMGKAQSGRPIASAAHEPKLGAID